MLERLEDRYRLLSRGYANTPHRQRSLLASVTWSYDLCSPQERLLWARLSVFAGGFGLGAAEHVCSGSGLEAGEVLDVLHDLIDKSLVTRDPADDLHYRMLETIRQFGMGRLAEAGEFEHYRSRHEQWFVDLAGRLGTEWTGPTQAVWLEHWRRNHANLRIVLEHCAAHPDGASTALGVVMSLEGYWLVTGLLAEARHWLELALSHDTGDGAGTGAGARHARLPGGDPRRRRRRRHAPGRGRRAGRRAAVAPARSPTASSRTRAWPSSPGTWTRPSPGRRRRSPASRPSGSSTTSASA